MPKKDFNMNEEWLSLSPMEQQGVTNFFNLHNAAHWVYEQLSETGQKFVSSCIKMNNDLQKKEKQQSESAQVS